MMDTTIRNNDFTGTTIPRKRDAYDKQDEQKLDHIETTLLHYPSVIDNDNNTISRDITHDNIEQTKN